MVNNMFKKLKIKENDKPIIISEFGGYALSIKGHVFNEENEYGYKKFKDVESLDDAEYNESNDNEVDNSAYKITECDNTFGA